MVFKMIAKQITINFITSSGEKKSILSPIGISLLEASQLNANTSMSGACGGAMACTTCHVALDSEWYNKVPEISEEENDMLDMAFNVQPTSRLGCQIMLTEDMDGMIVNIPEDIEDE
ncbi:2Fe-2S ferredoxin [Candidatus Xenohaliotis californiensis]|uniref:Adrenodoxin-like protein n=1 Tax=Candidatus Xenohaliotis californiensis TaxID=84677 RepID=A0ABP0ETK7_9RICK|nr:2Fe-2S ferredoxin [Candidatus Xenohaliotis californiensis]